MFYCNNLTLLTFTYYLKIFLAIGMTILPFILGERIFIKTIKYKQKNKKFDKTFIKKELKSLFYIFVIFTLTYTTHTILNQENNVCYMYAKSDIIKEYKISYYALKDQKVSNTVKEKYLETILVTSYSNLNNKNTLDLKKEEKKENSNNSKTNGSQVENKVQENFLQENDSRKLNKVYVEKGIFYYPKYIYGNKNTYSGMNCPSDPLKQGYNNKYGYNNYFYIRLTNFIEEAKKNGYKITFSTQGCRTYNTQVYYYNTMTKGRAASPGYSLHGFGIASDLEFYQKDGSVCSYRRTDSSCPSMGWAHQNAYKFGLTFPLLNASYKEDWHIEPINKAKY